MAVYVAIAWGATEIVAFLIEAFWGAAAATAGRRYLAILFISGFPVALATATLRHRAAGAFSLPPSHAPKGPNTL